MPSIRKHKKTSNVDVLLGEVRKHYGRVDLYQHFSQDMDRVTKAQVALDTAEDAMLAISNYEGGDVDSDDGEKYLKLYGFLQAVFLQQGAIKDLRRLYSKAMWLSSPALHELFVGTFAEPGKASIWRRIRELRNLTVGHPIEKGRRKEPRQRTFITRVSVTKGSFDYQVWNQGTGKTSFERANLSALCASYQREAGSHLRKVITALRRPSSASW